jgi:uncharacterized SAM-binding protein YcdF (DUF218 family)
MLRKRIKRTLLLLPGLLALAVLMAFLFPKQLLCVDSGPMKADVIIVLGGGAGERPVRAAELFQQGAAPKVIVSGEGDAEFNKQVLIKAGVPPGAIQLEPESRNTKENAVFSIALLRADQAAEARHAESDARPGQEPTPQPTLSPSGAERGISGDHRPTDSPKHRTTVIIVTSWYHSRRALRSFQHFAPDIQFYSRPAYAQNEQRLDVAEENKARQRRVRLEYVKLIGYWVRYGVCPF